MTLAAAYLRCSGRVQVDGDTWDRQIETIQRCATALGYEIKEFREEAIPGKTDAEDRPAWKAMLTWMAENHCTVILIERMDRLARLYRVQEELISELSNLGYTLIAADTREDITEAMLGDPMRRALVQIQGIFAELAKNMDVLKMRKAMQRIRAEGRKPGQANYSPDPVLNHRCEGRKPYGMHSKHPEELAVIERIKSLHSSGYTSVRIAQILNFAGFTTRKGTSWLPTQVSRIIKSTANHLQVKS